MFVSFKLADAEATSHMDWFPSVFPRNVRCVVSAVTDSRSALLLSDPQYRTPPPVPLHVGELNESARQEIVQHTLGKYNKVLFKVTHSPFSILSYEGKRKFTLAPIIVAYICHEPPSWEQAEIGRGLRCQSVSQNMRESLGEH